MKIQSKLLCNVNFHIDSIKITLPAKPTILELDDKKYAKAIPRLNKLVEEKGAVWIKKPTLSKEEQAKADAKALEAAKALVESASKSK